jgi:hydrogenase maturation protease
MGGPRRLVVCLGNPLRSDDGVGWAVADRLAGDPATADGVDVVCRQQLTPELAVDVSRAAQVVIVDARAGGAPGTVEVVPVAADGVDAGGAGWSHGLTPGALVALAVALYGWVPPVTAVGVAAGSFDAGEGLTPAVEAAVPVAVAAVLDELTA